MFEDNIRVFWVEHTVNHTVFNSSGLIRVRLNPRHHISPFNWLIYITIFACKAHILQTQELNCVSIYENYLSFIIYFPKQLF